MKEAFPELEVRVNETKPRYNSFEVSVFKDENGIFNIYQKKR